MTSVVHHLVTSQDWAQYTGADYRPPSLATEGFIHFSDPGQLDASAARHFAETTELLVVTVAVARLDAELRWEDLAGHGAFPHLYGPLNLDAVDDVRPYGQRGASVG